MKLAIIPFALLLLGLSASWSATMLDSQTSLSKVPLSTQALNEKGKSDQVPVENESLRQAAALKKKVADFSDQLLELKGAYGELRSVYADMVKQVERDRLMLERAGNREIDLMFRSNELKTQIVSLENYVRGKEAIVIALEKKNTALNYWLIAAICLSSLALLFFIFKMVMAIQNGARDRLIASELRDELKEAKASAAQMRTELDKAYERMTNLAPYKSDKPQ
jgi:hypothetical protein